MVACQVYVLYNTIIVRGGAVAARVTHNHEVAGSSPAPATKFINLIIKGVICPKSQTTHRVKYHL